MLGVGEVFVLLGKEGEGGGRGKWSLIKLHIISDKHGGFNDFR